MSAPTPPLTIKQRLAQGGEVRAFFLGALASPKLVEVVARVGGFHTVWIDQEHSAIPHADLELLLMACRASGIEGFARVAPTDYGAVMRPMEAGACGVMIAQIRTVAQAAQAVEWAKYPPHGTRGLFQGNFEAGYTLTDVQTHIDTANRDRWIALQIETPEAVEVVDELAALPHVDHLFVGPGDLACTLGVPGQAMHPKCIAALERVAAATKKAGKSWGVLTRGADHAAKCRSLGCQLFSLSGDLDIAVRGLRAVKDSYADWFA